MKVSFELDVEARCAGCGVECEMPEGTAERVLRTEEAIYADVSTRCLCGSSTVRVVVTVE